MTHLALSPNFESQMVSRPNPNCEYTSSEVDVNPRTSQIDAYPVIVPRAAVAGAMVAPKLRLHPLRPWGLKLEASQRDLQRLG